MSKQISYKLVDKSAEKDAIKFKIFDGFFTIQSNYEIHKSNSDKKFEKNDDYQRFIGNIPLKNPINDIMIKLSILFAKNSLKTNYHLS